MSEAIITRFALTNCERFDLERKNRSDDPWMSVIAENAREHGRRCAEADGKNFGPPKYTDITTPEYDGWKGQWYSEVLNG